MPYLRAKEYNPRPIEKHIGTSPFVPMRGERNVKLLAAYRKVFFPEVPADDNREVDAKYSHQFTVRRSRGNTQLQLGNYVTEDDVTALVQSVSEKPFSKRK